LYKKKPPKDSRTLPNRDPKIAPIRADLLLLGVSVIDVEVGLDVDGGDCGGGERSKVVVHIY